MFQIHKYNYNRYELYICLNLYWSRRLQYIKSLLKMEAKWSPEQDQILLSLYVQSPEDWQQISSKLETRSSLQCFLRFVALKNLDVKPAKLNWTSEEDVKLLQLFHKYSFDYDKISVQFEKTNQYDIYIRIKQLLYPESQKVQPVKIQNKQTNKQDINLLKFYGFCPEYWQQIAFNLGTTDIESVRKRYLQLNQIQEGIHVGQWTYEEDLKLLRLAQYYTCQWKLVSQQFGKDYNICYLRYRSICKQKLNNAKKPWTNEQVEYLRRKNQEYKNMINRWERLHKHFTYRTISALKQRIEKYQVEINNVTNNIQQKIK